MKITRATRYQASAVGVTVDTRSSLSIVNKLNRKGFLGKLLEEPHLSSEATVKDFFDSISSGYGKASEAFDEDFRVSLDDSIFENYGSLEEVKGAVRACKKSILDEELKNSFKNNLAIDLKSQWLNEGPVPNYSELRAYRLPAYYVTMPSFDWGGQNYGHVAYQLKNDFNNWFSNIYFDALRPASVLISLVANEDAMKYLPLRDSVSEFDFFWVPCKANGGCSYALMDFLKDNLRDLEQARIFNSLLSTVSIGYYAGDKTTRAAAIFAHLLFFEKVLEVFAEEIYKSIPEKALFLKAALGLYYLHSLAVGAVSDDERLKQTQAYMALDDLHIEFNSKKSAESFMEAVASVRTVEDLERLLPALSKNFLDTRLGVFNNEKLVVSPLPWPEQDLTEDRRKEQAHFKAVIDACYSLASHLTIDEAYKMIEEAIPGYCSDMKKNLQAIHKKEKDRGIRLFLQACMKLPATMKNRPVKAKAN